MRFCISSSPCFVFSLRRFGEVDFIHRPVSGGSLHFSDYPLFFDLAIQSFQKANTLDGIWFEPYWNIGLTYTMKTENVQDNNNINLLKKAVQDLNRALKCLDLDRQSQFTLSPPVKKAVPNILTSLIFDKKATERENIERWIKVLKAFVQVRIGIQTNDNKLIDQAKLVIDGIENSPNGWSDTSELDSGLLYNLACYHAILEECPGHCDEKLIGRRYLTYSLARKPKLVKSAKGDPALKNIIDGLDNLYDILIQELQVQDSKLKLTGDPFKVAISKVLIEANWSS